ncbi:putative ATP binding protein [Cinnamomum micranthum f. kanehirae]|uniref:Putative ATP binding protein n=1 Tax=Cinnamomum micranthum f. kanehirae TaxID=337451 RepID=A0A3S3M7B5_9MAGN|nr:putative ATP binding protein [Cinnamomum micranthum f. kanehirae]
MALHWLVQVFLWCLSSATITSSSSSSSSYSRNSENCQRSCGNVSIPYPFGMGEDPACFRNSQFNIICNESSTPPKALLRGQEVLDISLQGQLRAKFPIGWDCYSESGNQTDYYPGFSFDTYGSPYTFSNTRNKFTAIGCDTQAYVYGYPIEDSMQKDKFRFGCMSSCSNPTSVINGSCTGIGCCQSVIPADLKLFGVKIKSFNNHTDVWSFNPCSYAFFVDQEFNLNFSVSDLSNTDFRDRNGQVPVVIDWVVEWNETCQEATRNLTKYACLSENSECSDSINGPGYRCSCSAGYQGNPYVHGGCQDVNECLDKDKNNCVENCCFNLLGSYSCVCPHGTHGDGRINGTRTSLSLLLLLIGSTWTYWMWRKRRSIKLKEKFFQQNGGLLLQQKICSRKGDTFKIFTIEELKRATNNYNDSTIVGQGGYGIVYKGILPNNKIIAIKKSKLVDVSQIEQFINELDILSQINHRNVVKLLGCCLEDQVPILVYEFVSNGTLYHHIHKAEHLPSISIENRLRIAAETAEALAYLHSAASIPIIHRDVKSANILLDKNFTAKVSDFGISRLVPIDQTQITTLIQGTWGYLDPECFPTGKLTPKSDVFSFGVVLVELLTGKKSVCLNRAEEERNLAIHFLNAMKEDRLFEILEEQVRSEGSKEQLMAISRLAMRCLNFKGEERPIMKDVVVDLQELRGNSENCQRSCGNISIPYPFGMGEDPTCFRNQKFNITCNESFTPPKAPLGSNRIKFHIGWECYSESGYRKASDSDVSHHTDRSPYTFSNTRNKFTAIGCDTKAYVYGTPFLNMNGRHDFIFGCMSSCWNPTSVINGSCTGIGCCQTVIPEDLNFYRLEINSFSNHTNVWSFNPCSYAFFVDQDFNLNFSVSDLSNTNFRDRNGQVPVVFDWVVGWNETCQETTRNKTDYACLSENSECFDSTNLPGYRCSCSPGYQGNPYVRGGCQDVNEYLNKDNNNCKENYCINLPGSYNCACPHGTCGDGRINGTGISLCLLLLLIGSTWTYWMWRKRRSIKLKEKFFQQNGGLLLQQKICSRKGDTFKIFSIEELKRATNNYNDSMIVGQGGYGIVYKGILPNNKIIAIKKSKLVDVSQIEQFINELDILSQINHRSVVKLLGCCLKDQVPILVYEFVSNRTLYHHIHKAEHLPSISLENR